MALDPNIILSASAQPTQVPGPLDQYQKLLALQNAQTTNALNQSQLEGVDLENQQRQQDMQDVQNLRNLYAQARQTGQPVTNDQLIAAAPTKAPALIKANLDAQESLGRIQKAQQELADAGKEYIAGQAYAIQQSDYDPAVIEHMFQTAPPIYQNQVKQLQALYQQNPAAFKQQVDSAVAASPKQRSVAAEEQTAQARTDEATQTGQKNARELAQQNLKDTASRLSLATNPVDYALAWSKISPDLQKQFPDPKTFDPNVTPQQVLRVGMTPAEISADNNRKAAEAQTRAFQSTSLQIQQQNADTNAQRANTYQQNADNRPTNTNTKLTAQLRRTLDQAHQQRSAIGNALAVENNDSYVDPKTGKIAPQEMNDTIRKQLTDQYQNVTNQGARIMKQLGIPNEFTDTAGQAAYNAAPTPAAPTQQPAPKGQPTAAPAKTPAQTPKPSAPATQPAPGGIRNATGTDTGQKIASLEDVVRYGNANFGGDVKKAAGYLMRQGYRIQGSKAMFQQLGLPSN